MCTCHEATLLEYRLASLAKWCDQHHSLIYLCFKVILYVFKYIFLLRIPSDYHPPTVPQQLNPIRGWFPQQTWPIITIVVTRKGSLPRRVYVGSSHHHPLPHSKRETEGWHTSTPPSLEMQDGGDSLPSNQSLIPSLAWNARRRGFPACQPSLSPSVTQNAGGGVFFCQPTLSACH